MGTVAKARHDIVAMAAEKVMGDDPIDAVILTRAADNRLRQRPSSIS